MGIVKPHAGHVTDTQQTRDLGNNSESGLALSSGQLERLFCTTSGGSFRPQWICFLFFG